MRSCSRQLAHHNTYRSVNMNQSCEQLNVSPGNNFQERQQQQILQMQHCKIESQADIFAHSQVKNEQQFIDLNTSQEYSHVHHTHSSSIQAQDLGSSSHDYQSNNNVSPGGNNSYAASHSSSPSNLSIVQLTQKPQSIVNEASNNNLDASFSLQHQHQYQRQQSHSYNSSPVSSNGQQFSSATSPSSCAGQQVSLTQPFIKFEKKPMGVTQQHNSQMKQEGNVFRARVASYSAGCLPSHHHQNTFQSQSVSPQLNSNYYTEASQLTMLQSGQYSPQHQQQEYQHQQQQQQVADQQPKQQLSPPPIQLSSSDTMGFGINLEQYISKRNERERSRVRYVNDAFHNLQNILPLHSSKQSKRMSKVEILRSAMSYIKSLETLLDERRQQDNKSLVSLTNLGAESSISPASFQHQQQITFAQQHHQQQHIQQQQVVAHQQVQQSPNLFSNSNINNHCQALNNCQADNNIDSYNNTDNLINYQSQQQQQVSMQQHQQQFIANQNHVLQNHGHQQQFQQHAM